MARFFNRKDNEDGRNRSPKEDSRNPCDRTQCTVSGCDGTCEGTGQDSGKDSGIATIDFNGQSYKLKLDTTSLFDTKKTVNFAWNYGGTLPSGNVQPLSFVKIYSTGSFYPPKKEVGPLEVVKDAMPILASRYAKILMKDGKLTFASVAQYETFGVNAKASCLKADFSVTNMLRKALGIDYFYDPAETHLAPDENCQCGFYAVPADKLPEHKYAWDVLLQVELRGKVIEHERGYRAQHQRVLQAILGPCYVCQAAKASRLGKYKSFVVQETDVVVRLCDNCHDPYCDEFLSLNEISEQLGVPVTS